MKPERPATAGPCGGLATEGWMTLLAWFVGYRRANPDAAALVVRPRDANFYWTLPPIR